VSALDDAARQELRRYRKAAWLCLIPGLIVLVAAGTILPPDGATSESNGPAVIGMSVGGVAAVVGIASLSRARRQRRILGAHNWHRMPCRYGTFKIRNSLIVGNSFKALLMLDATTDKPSVILVPSLATFWSFKRNGLAGTKEVDVAVDPTRRMIARSVDSDRLVSLQAPRSDKEQTLF
jgi:hypothetical protein